MMPPSSIIDDTPPMPGELPPLLDVCELTRPAADRLTTLIKPDGSNVRRLSLPEHGSFNAGLIRMPMGELLLVYRPDEFTFASCLLDERLDVVTGSHRTMPIENCADPRLVWQGQYDRLIMLYSSYDMNYGAPLECIRATVICEPKKTGAGLIDTPRYVVSPHDRRRREKNWMPLALDGRAYMISSTCPHEVTELLVDERTGALSSGERWRAEWLSPWIYKNEFHRGNTSAVRVTDDLFLGTFHTAVRTKQSGRCILYDNGCYVFEARPPFRVLRCSRRTYLRAEDAVEPHYRKSGLIEVCFPVGMVLMSSGRLLISYGDNDSCVKILSTTVDEMLATTVEVYRC